MSCYSKIINIFELGGGVEITTCPVINKQWMQARTNVPVETQTHANYNVVCYKGVWGFSIRIAQRTYNVKN